MTLASALIAALYGLIIGSFLNVVIDRVPKHESVVSPRSRCPKCEKSISSIDNIPVISWVILRGKCRRCGLPISVQYPLVELGTAVLFGAIAVHFGPGWNLAIFLVLFAGLIPLATIDLQKQLLPKRIFYPVLFTDTALVIATALATKHWRELLIALATGAVWFGLFFVVFWIRPDALGFGDVRLVSLLGLCLGWLGISIAFMGFFISNLIGLGVGIFLLVTKRATRSTPMPFGLFLATGTAIAIFAGPPIVNHFQGLR